MTDFLICILLIYCIFWTGHNGIRSKKDQEKEIDLAYKNGFRDGAASVDFKENITDE